MPIAELPDTLSSSQLCELLNLPRRTLSTWTAAGIVKPTARGHWPTVETLRAIFNHVRTSSVPADSRAALTKQQVRLKKLQADELERRLIDRAECEEGWIKLAGVFISAIEQLPSRLAAAVAHASDDPAQVRGLLKAKVRAVRTELADALESLCSEARNGSAG